jgi:hypothetical protein
MEIANSDVTIKSPLTFGGTSTAAVDNTDVTIIAGTTAISGSGSATIDNTDVTIIAGTTAISGAGSVVVDDITIIAGTTDISGVGTFAITDFEVIGGTVDGSHSYSATSTMDIPAAGVTLKAPITISAQGSMLIVATVTSPVTTLERFGRFVVYDPTMLGEMALRKIAYVRQRER